MPTVRQHSVPRAITRLVAAAVAAVAILETVPLWLSLSPALTACKSVTTLSNERYEGGWEAGQVGRQK